MGLLPVTYSVNGAGRLIGTVTGTGDGGVENGLALISQPFTSTGSVDVDLGAAVQSVSTFSFVLGDDASAAIVAVAADQTLTVIDATGATGATGASPGADVLQRFWNGITPETALKALHGAVEQWIVENAVGGPLLVVVGFISGGTAFALTAAAKAADLAALFIVNVATQEAAQGMLTAAEATAIETWARASDSVLQLPAVLTDESALVRVTGVIAADVNFESESENAKLGVTFAADGVSKYTLALKALSKVP